MVTLAQDDRPDRDDPWLTPIEIAKEIRVNAATIRLWISKGLLPATRAGQRKLLVRRSDVMRLLAENSSAGGVQPYRRPQHPRYAGVADSGAPIKGGWSTSSLFAREGDPKELLAAAQALQEADRVWGEAQAASDDPPPDPGFGSRVRALAEACEQQARCLKAAADVPGLVWNPEPDARLMVLSYELRPGASRPGPVRLWQRFDSAVQLLGIAKEGMTMSLVAAGYAEVATVMHEIAAALEAQASPGRRRKSA
ncbi:MAG: helix-turn-helix domain-containing protein [Solirubrobacteraceae bacterium]